MPMAPTITNINDGSQLPNKSKNPITLWGCVIPARPKPKEKITPAISAAIEFFIQSLPLLLIRKQLIHPQI